MSTSPDQIVLTAAQRLVLAQLADNVGKPWDIVLQEMLSNYQFKSSISTENESFFEAASRLGLIGCVKGGPSDLSTNPMHMEGFGKRD